MSGARGAASPRPLLPPLRSRPLFFGPPQSVACARRDCRGGCLGGRSSVGSEEWAWCTCARGGEKEEEGGGGGAVLCRRVLSLRGGQKERRRQTRCAIRRVGGLSDARARVRVLCGSCCSQGFYLEGGWEEEEERRARKSAARRPRRLATTRGSLPPLPAPPHPPDRGWRRRSKG